MALQMTDAERNAKADADAARFTHASLHTGAPGTASTPANEATGGSPAYARKPIANWAASGAVGPLGASVQPATVGTAWGSVTFDAPAGTYTHVGFCTSATGATYREGKDMSASYVLAAQGTVPVSLSVVY